MLLHWISVALTLTGVFIWFSGGNRGLGYWIFMAGGVMWFILQRVEKKKQDKDKQAPMEPIAKEPNETRKSKSPQQSD